MALRGRRFHVETMVNTLLQQFTLRDISAQRSPRHMIRSSTASEGHRTCGFRNGGVEFSDPNGRQRRKVAAWQRHRRVGSPQAIPFGTIVGCSTLLPSFGCGDHGSSSWAITDPRLHCRERAMAENPYESPKTPSPVGGDAQATTQSFDRTLWEIRKEAGNAVFAGIIAFAVSLGSDPVFGFQRPSGRAMYLSGR